MIAVFATVRAQPGRRAELIDAIRADVLPIVAQEDGTLEYRVHEDLRDPELVLVYEVYDSKEAFITHVKAVGPRLNAMGDLMDGAPELQQAVPIDA